MTLPASQRIFRVEAICLVIPTILVLAVCIAITPGVIGLSGGLKGWEEWALVGMAALAVLVGTSLARLSWAFARSGAPGLHSAGRGWWVGIFLALASAVPLILMLFGSSKTPLAALQPLPLASLPLFHLVFERFLKKSAELETAIT